jgi:hypothetical protein
MMRLIRPAAGVVRSDGNVADAASHRPWTPRLSTTLLHDSAAVAGMNAPQNSQLARCLGVPHDAETRYGVCQVLFASDWKPTTAVREERPHTD